MNNTEGQEVTVDEQFKKLQRALRITLNVGPITFDEYNSILQLMRTIDGDACLMLDNTHENI